MDKKQNFYSRQCSSKALVSEPRKSTDVSVIKPRSAHRRENPSFSNSKNDSQRSSKPAKTRPYVDKRPRQRGGGGTQSLNLSASSSGLVEADANNGLSDDFNSVYNQACKQNLNHLLNFNYSPREQENSTSGTFFGRNGNRNFVKKHKYNKEQFLQANFQFIINLKAESSILAASSPDTLVDWSLIEQINIQTSDEPQCPICLYPPIAAKLTKCGHAYCWPCILHYLALTDKVWRKCPICYDAIYQSDLKSTAIVQQAVFKVGDFVILQLMRRKKGSMFIEKIDDMEHNGKIPHVSADVGQKFSKFLVADSNEILSIIEREREELISCKGEDCPEFVFIQQALDLLSTRKSTLIQPVESAKGTGIKDVPIIKNTLSECTSNCTSSGRKCCKNEENSENLENAMENLNIQHIQNGSVPKDSGKYYYFYQSVDGQNVFLHPLNVKMLQAMYGSLDKSPPIINAKILQKEIQSMDEDLRKKYTCLGHLPLTCEFETVEVQLDPPLISEDVLILFKDNLMLRQKTRMRRAREEIKRERQIDQFNERQLGKIRSANIDIKSSQQFPMCGSEDGSIRSSFGEASFLFDLSDSPPATLPSMSKTNFASFANILSSPKRELWPSLGNGDGTIGTNELSSPSVTSEASWSKPLTIVRSGPAVNSDESSCNDAAYYARQNFGEVLAEALQQKKQSDRNNADKGAGNSKKAKKNKKMLLFSMGMNFNGN